MRVARLLLKVAKPDIAGMIEGGISFETTDMAFDSTELQRRYPQVALTRVAEAVRAQFGKTGGIREANPVQARISRMRWKAPR
jgi:hypothetical protein